MDNSGGFNNQPVQPKLGGLYAVIAILVVLVLVLGGFVVYKEFIQKDDNSSNTNTQTNTDKTNTKTEVKDDTVISVSRNDVTGTTITYKKSSQKSVNGISFTISNNKKSVELSVNSKKYSVVFDKEVKDIVCDSNGVDGELYYLMQDGSIEYTIFILSNVKDDIINHTTLSGISGVTSIVPVIILYDVDDGSSFDSSSVIGYKADGTWTDLVNFSK